MKRGICVAGAIAAALLGGCANEAADSSYRDRTQSVEAVDPTPADQSGVPSDEFEQADIDQANGASEAVKEYCAGAVSEAQYVGCISHVTDSDIP